MKADLNALFLAHGGELRRYLTRQVRCPQTAADLLQDVFVSVAAQGTGTRIGNTRAYLFQTARNLLIDHARKEARQRTQPTPLEGLNDYPDDGPTAEQMVAARQDVARLVAAVAELPPLTRSIFELNRLHGHTYEEVAERLNISESSVQKHLARALLHALRRLEAA